MERFYARLISQRVIYYELRIGQRTASFTGGATRPLPLSGAQVQWAGRAYKQPLEKRGRGRAGFYGLEGKKRELVPTGFQRDLHFNRFCPKINPSWV